MNNNKNNNNNNTNNNNKTVLKHQFFSFLHRFGREEDGNCAD